MQKVKTQEYEVMARMLSQEPLYEIRWKNHIFISHDDKLKDFLCKIWYNYSVTDVAKYESDRIISHALTVRGAWKKACKNLNKQCE